MVEHGHICQVQAFALPPVAEHSTPLNGIPPAVKQNLQLLGVSPYSGACPISAPDDAAIHGAPTWDPNWCSNRGHL
jgi:hypothetical protein